MGNRIGRAAISFVISLAAVALCLALAAAALSWLHFGREPGESFWVGLSRVGDVVWRKSLLPGRNDRYWIQSLLAATPLLLTGLAVAVAFRANVLNIGAEGQLVVGAVAATWVGLAVRAPAVVSLTMLLSGAALAGAVWAGVAAVLERWRGVPVVLSTLLLNFVAAVALKALLQGPLHEAGSQLQSEQLPDAARLPHVLVNGARSQLHVGLFVALACAVVLSLVLRYTTFGFRLRATGANEVAARFAGFNVNRIGVLTLAISGALAGLAGGMQVGGVPPYQLLPDTASTGLGFAGIAVALLGRLSPLGVVLAALFFGWLQTAFAALQAELGVPFLALQAAQGLILVTMVALTSGHVRGR